MNSGEEFMTILKNYFKFLESEFDYQLTDSEIRGNAFYDIKYRNNNNVISISYENIEERLLVILFILNKDGSLPSYDKDQSTIHLSTLNNNFFPHVKKDDIVNNNLIFSKFYPKNVIEKKILKEAKELRLCLKYL